jgi:hypothetical protein
MAIARTAIVAVLSVLCAWSGLPLRRAAAEESAELTAAFARAADAIRRHQSPEGYWKTPVTTGPVFERPTTELNVFTPAVMIDVVDPVARETGLTDVLARARGYCAARSSRPASCATTATRAGRAGGPWL